MVIWRQTRANAEKFRTNVAICAGAWYTQSILEGIHPYLVLVLLSFLCLFFFYVLVINSTRTHFEIQ